MEIALVIAVLAVIVLAIMLIRSIARIEEAEEDANKAETRAELLEADLDYARESIRQLEPLAAIGRAAKAQRKAASDAAAAKRRAKKAA